MTTMLPRHPRALAVAFGFAAALASLPAFAADSTAKSAADDSPNNYVELSAGGALAGGDHANFQKELNRNQHAWGGIDGFSYFKDDIGDKTSFSLTGHALAGLNDYLLDLRVDREDVGYLHLGFKRFRTWYDGNGGFFPLSNLFIAPVNPDLFIDRTSGWFEAGFIPSPDLKLTVRYDYQLRQGLTDSTSWADTTLTGGAGTRAVVPTFQRINEERHIFNLDLAKDGGQTRWTLGGRYELDRVNDDLEIHRTPGEAKTDRYVTQDNGSNSDTLLFRGSIEHRLNEQLLLTSGAAYYKIDTTLDGSRIYGVTPDPVFDPSYARRQYHDEGFHDLTGSTAMRETMANLSLMYTPTKTLTIVPALKADRTTWDANDNYVEAAVGAGPSFAMATDDQDGLTNKNYREYTGSIEARYNGIKNWAFNALGEVTNSYGTLNEDLYAIETGVDTIYRTTDYHTGAQRVALTADWYARSNLSFTAQYYWKGRQDHYANDRDSVSAAPTSGDRYPGYIANQDYVTNDVNFRASWRAMLNLRFVTRYDYQESTINTRAIGLASIESGKLSTNILSETATWNPLARWYLQGSVNVVYDQLKTPASSLTGAAGGIVLNSDNNYVNTSLSTGYALDDQTDVSLEYDYYASNNYVNNSYRSVAYGADGHQHYVTVTWRRRISPRTEVAVKYAYADNHDLTSGNNDGYHGHLIYTKLTYRF